MDMVKMPLPELMARADSVRRRYIGKNLDLCSIINAKSGLCGEDCKFCAQSALHNTGAAQYPLKDSSEIIEAARKAKESGAGRFGIVTSGNRLTPFELDKIALAIAGVAHNAGMTACASLGALSAGELLALKSAGLKRYHHNIETSERFYPNVVTTHTFAERVRTIEAAKEAGLEVCSGGIIGMGESWQDRIDMARTLNELGVDSVPVNFLIPIKGTPFESLATISAKDAIRTIAIFRIILKDKTIKIAAGRETVLRDFQGMGFLAGANGMLIGGYLTVRGRDTEADRALVKEIEKLWEE